MRSRITDGLLRTNNSVEGWHHAFQSSVACHHPNIYKLMDHIQTEQDHTEQQIARFSAGNQTSVSSKNKYIQDVLQLCCLRTVTDRYCSTREELHTTSNFRFWWTWTERLILSDAISKQFNKFIVYVCVCNFFRFYIACVLLTLEWHSNFSSCAHLSAHICLRIFIGAILSARFCLHAVVAALLSCTLLSMNRFLKRGGSLRSLI